MKLIVNESAISDDLNEVLVTAAIRALKDGDTCRLERHDSFMDAIRNSKTEFWLQYQDADTGILLEHDPLAVPQKVVVDAFNSFFLQNGAWKTSCKWKEAEQQPDYQALLKTAAGEKAHDTEPAPPSQLVNPNPGAPSLPPSSVWDTFSYGPDNPNMICQHCQTKGGIHTKQVAKKVGISGGKATAGLLTAGLSLFVLGLSRKETVTEAHCRNCGATWHF